MIEATPPMAERTGAESALRESTKWPPASHASAVTGSFVWHVGEARTVADARMLELLGLFADQPLDPASAALQGFIHPDDRERYMGALARALDPSGPGTLREDVRIVRADGTLGWLTITATTEFGGSPLNALRVTGQASDISDRLRSETTLAASRLSQTLKRHSALIRHIGAGAAESELRDSRKRLQLAVDAAAMGTFIWHVGEDRGEPDARMLELFGLRDDQDLNLAIASKLIHPDDGDRHRAAIEAALDPAGPGILREDLRVVHPDGTLRWLTIFGNTEFAGSPPQAVRMSGVGIDVTERLRGEAALRANQERHAFLLELSDTLRRSADPAEIQAAATRILVRHLKVKRAFYAQAEADGEHVVIHHDHGADAGSSMGRYRLDEFGRAAATAFRAGRTVVVQDVMADAGLSDAERTAAAAAGVRAHATVCLVKQGRLVALLGVRQDEPRAWTADEVSLIEQTAERTWAAVERARTENALAESEDKYRTLFNSIDDAICTIEMIYDASGKPVDYRLVEINQNFEKQTGIANASGKRAKEIMPTLKQVWPDTFGAVASSGEPVRLESYNESIGRWFSIYAARIGGEGSRQVVVVFNDITERKRHERDLAFLAVIHADLSRLKTAEEIMQLVGARLGAFLDVSTSFLADIDEGHDEARLHYIWDTEDVPRLPDVVRISNFTSEEIRHTLRAGEMLVIQDTENDPRVDPATYRAIRTRTIVGVPFHRHGLWRFVLAVSDSRPRVWRDDEIELFRELSTRLFPRLERARAEAALRESEQRLAEELAAMRRLHELGERLAQSHDMETLLREILAASAEFTSTDKGLIQLYDASTRRLRIVVHQGLGPRVIERFAEDGWGPVSLLAARRKERVIVEDVARLENVADAWDLRMVLDEGIRAVQCTPLVARDGRLLGTLGNYFRVTGRPDERTLRLLDLLARQASDLIEHQQADDALRDAGRRKDEFLAMLAHELRNPLAPVRNAAHVLRGTSDANVVREMADVLERQVTHMVRLVDDLLDVSRVSRGKIELRREPTELTAVINQSVETVRTMLAGRDHELTLVEPTHPVYVNADPARLTQIVGNLLHNACKFTERHGHIRLSIEQQAGEAIIRVQDDGIGIPADQIERIFEMFTQVDTSLERSQSGLGIGLTLVRILVQMHGGTITVYSAGTGKGSEFVVRLPALATAPVRMPASGPKEDAQAATVRRRILVVDDNADASHTVGAFLQLLGHEVCTAFDGLEAVEAAAKFMPDVVLLDIGLPRLNGYEAARRIREQRADYRPTLVAVTGWGQDEDRRRSEDAGFDAHMVKPVDSNALVKLLADLGAH